MMMQLTWHWRQTNWTSLFPANCPATRRCGSLVATPVPTSTIFTSTMPGLSLATSKPCRRDKTNKYVSTSSIHTINWTELHLGPHQIEFEKTLCDLLFPQNDHFLFHQLQLKQFQIGNSPHCLVHFLSVPPVAGIGCFLSTTTNKRDFDVSRKSEIIVLYFVQNSKIRFCMSSTKSWSPFWHLLVIRNSPIPTPPVSWKEPEVSIWDPIKSGDFYLKTRSKLYLFFHFNIDFLKIF